MSSMQQISAVAMNELREYLQKAESRFMEDTFLAEEHRVVIENCLQEWYAFTHI